MEIKVTTLTDRLDRLPSERRRKVEQRTRALIAEETSLRGLRKGRRPGAIDLITCDLRNERRDQTGDST